MKYNELSDSAKEKVRNECRDHLFRTSYEWWEPEYKLFKDVGGSFGLRIDDIYWSGFWCQGDGASFAGVLDFKETDPTQLPKDIQPIYTRLKEIHAMLRLALEEDLYFTVTQHGRAVHEQSMDIIGGLWDILEEDGDPGIAFDFYEELLELMRDYARWIYSCLEDEYESLTSDEAVEKTILANDYNFDKEGNWL